jgi:hypothetical protein
VTSNGAEEFEGPVPAGGSGRSDNHCKTSEDMLMPRCRDEVLQSASVHCRKDNAEPARSLPTASEGSEAGHDPTTRLSTLYADRSRGQSVIAHDMSVVDAGLDGEHRAGRVEQDALGV